MTKHMALHETLEVHELLTFKNLALTKSLTMSPLVQDEQLKNIMQADAEAGTAFIHRLKELLTDRGHES